MAQSVTLKYTPTQQDYAQVLRLIMLRSTVNQILMGFLVLGFVFILFNMVIAGHTNHPLTLIWLLLPPLFIIYIIFYSTQSYGKTVYERMNSWQQNVPGKWVMLVCKFPPALARLNYEWDKLSKLVTTKDYYLLYVKKSRYAPRFLPRRSFTSAEEQDTFLQLMTSHLSK